MQTAPTLRLVSIAGVALALPGWAVLLWQAHGALYFDDAYMFYRYAEHLRMGLGLCWNLDRVPTYGMTSLLWQAVVTVFSLLPLSPTHCLLLCSWLCCGAAVLTTAYALWSNAQSAWLRRPAIAIALVGFSLFSLKFFRINARTGMETMLAMALLALLLALILAQPQRRVSPWLIGAAALLLALARPEAALPAAVLLLLSVVLVPEVRAANVLRSLAVLACGVALTLLLARLYFHSWLPLSFYLKSRDGYLGYRMRWYPVTSALAFLRTGGGFLLALALLARRRDARLLLLHLLPLALVMAYLCTVTQIMGMAARYFMPYLPLLAVPALLLLDGGLHEYSTRASAPRAYNLPAHACAAALVVAFLLYWRPLPLQAALEARAEPRVLGYSDVVFVTPATQPLPTLAYDDTFRAIADGVVSALPAGATVAASEVGYLGARFPRINVIDLAGLNDNPFARQGFSPDALIDRHPDLIWMPHDDYTLQRGLLLTDPRLLREFDLYAGAMNYSVAIAKNGPYRALLESRLAALWPQLYPGTTPEEYLTSAVRWDRRTYLPPVQPSVR